MTDRLSALAKHKDNMYRAKSQHSGMSCCHGLRECLELFTDVCVGVVKLSRVGVLNIGQSCQEEFLDA